MLEILVGLVGAVATFVDSILGMGFGVLSSSLLITVGVYPAMASASVHIGKVFTGFLSGGAHLWFGNVKREWLWPLAISGVLGGASGAYLLASLPGKSMRPYVAGILLILGMVVFYRFMPERFSRIHSLKRAYVNGPLNNGTLRKAAESPRRLPFLGFVAAFVDAVGGGGWGPIVTPGLILTGNEYPHKVIGTVNLAEVFAAVAISVTFIITLGLGSLPWHMIAALLVGGLVAAPIGAYLCKKLPSRFLGLLTALALIAINLSIVVNALS